MNAKSNAADGLAGWEAMSEASEKKVFVHGVGWVPLSQLDAALVLAEVNLAAVADAEIIDATEDERSFPAALRGHPGGQRMSAQQIQNMAQAIVDRERRMADAMAIVEAMDDGVSPECSFYADQLRAVLRPSAGGEGTQP